MFNCNSGPPTLPHFDHRRTRNIKLLLNSFANVTWWVAHVYKFSDGARWP